MQNTGNLIEKAGNDYLITPGIGAHKLHLRKLPWYKARKICIQEGGEFLIEITLNECLISATNNVFGVDNTY